MSERNARLTEQIVAAVKGFVARAASELRKEIAGLRQRLDELPTREQLKGEPGRDGTDGKSVDPVTVKALVEAAVAALPPAAAGRDGRDGRDIDMAEVKGILEGLAAALPKPVDGRDGRDGKDGEKGADGRNGVDGRDGVNGERGVDGLNGKDGEKGADGRNGVDGRDGVNGERGVDGLNGKDGAAGRDGADGRDGKSLTLDEVKGYLDQVAAGLLPSLVNKAFADAEDGLIARAANQVPIIQPQKGEDGERGKDGADGVSIEDFDIELRDGRNLVVKLRGAERVIERQVKLHGFPVDCGFYQHGKAYEQGDWITYGGSIWVCTADTAEPPKGPSDSWKCRVKGGK